MSFRRPAGSFRLWGEEEKENGGRHSPFLLSRRRPGAEKSLRLGAKGTEEQGFAGIRALSPRRPGAEKSPRLGAKGTEEQGFAGIRAPSPRRPSTEKARRLGAKGTKEQGFAGVRAPTPCRKIGKGGPDTGRVGARLPAKPCTSVTRRQHFAVKPGRRRLQLIRQPAAKNNKKRATSVARSWCAIRGSNPGHPD